VTFLSSLSVEATGAEMSFDEFRAGAGLGVRITGTGSYVPPRRVSNEELAPLIGVTGDWIEKRTGIRHRAYIERPGISASDLGAAAARAALEMAERSADDVDALVFATVTPDMTLPGSGAFLQRSLGLADGVPAFDVRAQCSGFIYALQLAEALLKSRIYRSVLVVGAEVHSCGLDFSPRGRDATPLFGDGAGACLLEWNAGERGHRLLSTHVHGDGRFAEVIRVEAPGSRLERWQAEDTIEDGRAFVRMDGLLTAKWAVRRMLEATREALDTNGLKISEVDHLITHQANARLNEKVFAVAGVPRDRCHMRIQDYGNLSAASIPVVLDEVCRAGDIRAGNIVVLAAFGAGFTWGSAAIRW
jgi:3-oxoacyl-[acyl-carrier-protein] synthase III